LKKSEGASIRLTALLHQFSGLVSIVVEAGGGYWLIAGLMALESTFVPFRAR